MIADVVFLRREGRIGAVLFRHLAWSKRRANGFLDRNINLGFFVVHRMVR